MRGRVRHVLMDLNNPEHVKTANELGANVLRGEGFGVMLQFFEGKPSGYVEFEQSSKSKEAHITHIYVKPELRDTVQTEKIKKEGASKKISAIINKSIDAGKRPNKREEVRLRSLRRAERGTEKRKNQLFLGIKLVKSLNSKLGLNPSTTHGTSAMGMKHIEKTLYGRIRRRR